MDGLRAVVIGLGRPLRRAVCQKRFPIGQRALGVFWSLEQFQEKCDMVFRSELRKNKEIERFAVSVKR
ncbi:hypothetical protein X740_06860 [Mesorhizobium sp. LNHC221B00]|nr:hypothetical protein X740_06860 [Mesorhizobium sp. LNHC221B00]